jgi:hypothetical protein
LISDRYHFIETEAGEVELYDWQADRGEVNDLASTPEGQALISQLKLLIHAEVNQQNPVPISENK